MSCRDWPACMISRLWSAVMSKSRLTCSSMDRCCPVSTTIGASRGDRSSSRTTGAILMASGRVPGSEVSRRDLLQRRLLQLRISEQPLQRGVLSLQVLQPLGVVGFQAAELVPPPVVGLLRDTQLAADVGDVPALGQQPISLGRKAGVDCRIVRRRCSIQRLDW